MRLSAIVFAACITAAQLASSCAFAPSSQLPLRSRAFAPKMCNEPQSDATLPSETVPSLFSRRNFVASAVSEAMLGLGLPAQAQAEGPAVAKKEKILIYGQDANQVLAEVGVTGLGFFVVFAPTLLRASGLLEDSAEAMKKYPDRLWTIDGKNTDGTPADGKRPEDDSPSSGKSL